MKNISGAIQGLSGSVGGSQFGAAASAAKSLTGGASLATVAMGGINPGMLSKLNSLLSSIGHGALNIALPSTITNAFKTDGLAASAKAKLGGKIPSPTFGTGKAPEVNTAGLSKLNSLSEKLNEELANFTKVNEAYISALSKYGEDSSQAKAALARVTTSVQKMETLSDQVLKTVIV
jgi:hypothetical protein